MGARNTPIPEPAVAIGDTVCLTFTGPGRHRTEPLEYLVRKGRAWSRLLEGKKVGDSVTLPEAEENEVYAVIQSISS